MRAERILWRLAVVCALLLLFGPLGGRTMWIKADGSAVRDAAGYDWLAFLSGVVALLALLVGMAARPRVAPSVLCAACAMLAFGLTAIAAGGYWISILSGDIRHSGYVLDRNEGWIVYPASGPPYFAVIAIVGVAYVLVLLASWLRPTK